MQIYSFLRLTDTTDINCQEFYFNLSICLHTNTTFNSTDYCFNTLLQLYFDIVWYFNQEVRTNEPLYQIVFKLLMLDEELVPIPSCHDSKTKARNGKNKFEKIGQILFHVIH